MNADLKRVREGAVDDGLSPSAKRRAMGLSTPPPPGDQDDDDKTEDWMRVVEVKRKEAIYRQMLEYRRSYEREQRRASELEAQRRVLEASVQAVEVCWTQLVAAVRDLAGRQDLEMTEQEASQPVLDPQLPLPELDKALQSRLPATRQLIHRFVTLASSSSLPAPSHTDLQARCQQLQAESSTLRSQTSILQGQMKSLAGGRDQLQSELQRAQKALDRQRMEHDKVKSEWREQERASGAGTPKGAGVKANGSGSGNATPNGKVEEDVKPFGDAPGASSSVLLPDTTELEQLAEKRLQQYQTLQTDHTTLRQEADRLRMLAHNPSEAVLRDSPFFQVYLHQLATFHNRSTSLQQRAEASEKKLDELRDNNFEFREAVLAEARQEVEALRSSSGRKDADLARLRGQRDEMQAELTERKMREEGRGRWAEEMEGLATAREERINWLGSEIRRLKGALAARDGAEGYLAWLREGGGIDGNFVRDLERKVKEAEDRVEAWRKRVEVAGGDAEVASAAVADKAELEGMKRKLEGYGRLLGPKADAAEDVRELAARLETVEGEKRKLELELSEAHAAQNALFAEVEGLSKLYEGLDQKVKSKVFVLKDGELKMARLTTEKAKADNKYFQAMRAKEAIEAEYKTAQRSVEKQLKLLEKAHEVEKALTAQVSAHEKGLTALKNSAYDLQTQLANVSSEKTQLEMRLQQAQTSLAQAQELLHQRVSEAASEKSAREKLQDEMENTQRQTKKLKERLETLAAAGSKNVSANEYQMKEERDKLLKLLRCSCCEQNFKQQVITKCMHTFCKNCLDARIASRQRKCPACGLAFAKEEVQTLYWQ